jgi:hypothetical protein
MRVESILPTLIIALFWVLIFIVRSVSRSSNPAEISCHADAYEACPAQYELIGELSD